MQILLLDDSVMSFRVRFLPYFSQHKLDGWILIVTQHSLVNKARINLVDGTYNWLWMVGVELKFAHTETLDLMLVSKVIVYAFFIVVANGRNVEEPNVVLEADPETAVIFIDEFNLALCRFCPFGGLVAPVT